MTIPRFARTALSALLLLFALASAALLPTIAQAEQKTKFYATQSAVMSACKSSGGIETNGWGSGGYGCLKKNCDGKGGGCSVECTAGGDCDGFGPKGRVVRPGRGISGFLGGAIRLLPSQPPQSLVWSGGSGSGSGSPAPTPAPTTPPIFN